MTAESDRFSMLKKKNMEAFMSVTGTRRRINNAFWRGCVCGTVIGIGVVFGIALIIYVFNL